MIEGLVIFITFTYLIINFLVDVSYFFLGNGHIQAAVQLCGVPEATPLVKISNTEALGAEVELRGENLDESLQRARELEAEQGYTFVHPFDDEAVIAGQGAAGLFDLRLGLAAGGIA